jgi:catechol 2,3-dioxygenase-like lactoylglutathione lyase family enzyme
LSGPRSRATRVNHISIPAADLDESTSFYIEVFDVEPVPAPNFGFPVRWLRLGDTQLHLQCVDLVPARGRTYQHFGVEVEDFMATFRTLERYGAFDAERGTRYEWIWLLPSGELQMFFRDPFGNLVEVDWPDASTLDLGALGDRVRVLDQEEQQSADQRRATLFLAGD